MTGLLSWLDYAGVATFAMSNAIVARRSKADLTATLLTACVAAVGGGTLRDLLIGRPVFWIGDPGYIVASLVAATGIWLQGVARRGAGVITILDSIGIGCFAVVGAAKAIAAGTSPLVSVAMGVLTATFGGIVSDALASRNTVLARREIYVTAALASAAAYNLLLSAGAGIPLATSVAIVVGTGLRLAAWSLGWLMPGPPGATRLRVSDDRQG